MTGTPTSALQVGCGEPPLRLRRTRMMVDDGLRISSLPNHPSTETLTDKWSHHYSKFHEGREPFRAVVKKITPKVNMTDTPVESLTKFM